MGLRGAGRGGRSLPLRRGWRRGRRPGGAGDGGRALGRGGVVDPGAYPWRATGWRGRPWEETVIEEIHVGTFTAEGTFRAAIDRLGALAEIGITAIELMPVAQFAGTRGWGYDGVLLYAPHDAYGTPDDLRALVDAAHEAGLMVFLDVVYNHFGPEGNPLGRLAPEFFHPERSTPWGIAIAYETPAVRRFFIDNALYWLDEFRFDGLRFDAADHVVDADSEEEILAEMAREVRARFPDRHVHLATEDNRNIVGLHPWEDGRPLLHTAEWNDDLHNVAHVVATGETEGYYVDFAEGRWAKLARALAEGFAYQGEPSRLADGAAAGRGERGAAAARLHRLHPEPRPDRQPRLRRAADGAGARADGAGADGDPAAVAARAAAVHGAGMGREAALRLLLRLRGRPRRFHSRGTAGRVRALRRLPRPRRARRHSRPERSGVLRGLEARLGGARGRRRPRLARLHRGAAGGAAPRGRAASRGRAPWRAGGRGRGRRDRRRLAARRGDAAAAREPRCRPGAGAARGGPGDLGGGGRAAAGLRRPGHGGGRNDPARDLPAAVRAGLRLRRCGAARPLSRSARGEPRLSRAGLRGAAGEHPRL